MHRPRVQCPHSIECKSNKNYNTHSTIHIIFNQLTTTEMLREFVIFFQEKKTKNNGRITCLLWQSYNFHFRFSDISIFYLLGRYLLSAIIYAYLYVSWSKHQIVTMFIHLQRQVNIPLGNLCTAASCDFNSPLRLFLNITKAKHELENSATCMIFIKYLSLETSFNKYATESE